MTAIIILSLIVMVLALIIILIFISNAFHREVKEIKYKVQFTKYVKFEIFASFQNNINN